MITIKHNELTVIKKLLFSIVLSSQLLFSQQETKKEKTLFGKIRDNFYGSFESNGRWYISDKELGTTETENQVRANSYLNLNYNFLKNFTFGVQVESYEPTHLKNYYEGYKKTKIANYFANYKSKKIDITLGHYYEQFGNGLILRAFEERALGLNNALRGAKITYNPFSFLNATVLYGKNRYGFETSKSDVFGFDTNINLSETFKIDNLSSFNIGFSYVGRKQVINDDDVKSLRTIKDIVKRKKPKIPDDFPELVNAFSFRSDIDFGSFYTNFEYVTKSNEVAFKQRRPRYHIGKYYKGNALLFTMGYAKKGIGISGTFRRLENMSFFAERAYDNIIKNQYGVLSLNYLPSLTKQYSYSLANIYIHQAQTKLVVSRSKSGLKLGEIGGLVDFFYTFKKRTALGGKYGTKLSSNLSYWALPEAEFDTKNLSYKSDFLKFGKKMNRSFSINLNKKFSRKVKSEITYINTILYDSSSYIDFEVLATETTVKFKNRRSLKVKLQHLWTTQDKRNWLASGLEFNLNRSFSFYADNMINYGNEDIKRRVNFYNFGANYTTGATRIALNYGRQRGGLFCAGGICRFVDDNTGLSLNINTSF